MNLLLENVQVDVTSDPGRQRRVPRTVSAGVLLGAALALLVGIRLLTVEADLISFFSRMIRTSIYISPNEC
jgi:hypothetical protein